MNTKLILIAAALLFANPTSTAKTGRDLPSIFTLSSVSVRLASAPAKNPEGKDGKSDHTAFIEHLIQARKNKIHHEEDDNHGHPTEGRFPSRRHRFALWACRLGIAAAFFGCFVYCFHHLTRSCLFGFLSDCFSGVFG